MATWKPKLVRNTEQKLSARDLKMNEHFEKKDLTSLLDVGEGLRNFLLSLGKDALMLGDSSTKIALQRLVISFEIMESSQMVS